MKYRAKNMAEVIANHKAVGLHFFDEDTMEFWGCKIETELLDGNLFVTSDDNFDRTKKLYSVRQYDPETAEVDTVAFQSWDNLDDAIEWIEMEVE